MRLHVKRSGFKKELLDTGHEASESTVNLATVLTNKKAKLIASRIICGFQPLSFLKRC